MTNSQTTSHWQGKCVVVTGGSAGLGLEIARAFGQRGAQVIIAGRDAKRLQAAASALQVEGCRATPCTADVTRDEDAARLVEFAAQTGGRLDALVNNVGRSTRGAALDVSPQQHQELFEVNFLSAVRCTRAAAPHLIASRGHVVNIGSLAGKIASRFLGAYPPSKFALTAYTQQLRLELAEQGVHVLLVCPGPIARPDAGSRYDEQVSNLPESARRPGGGVKLRGIEPAALASRIVAACERRKPELVLPGKARLLFALAQLSPKLGDWLIKKNM